MADPASLNIETGKGCAHSHARFDCRRDTRLSVTTNVNGHPHITLGQNEATLILHPHFARRLIADLQVVLAAIEGER